MSKKIGLLNFQYSTHNYGAVLQAAALEYIFKSEGHAVEHINFIPQHGKRRLEVRFKEIVRRILVAVNLLKPKTEPKMRNSEAFERFREKFIVRTQQITNKQQFSSIAREYDTIVVGSDQVWRSRMATDPAAFFLSYVPESTDRASYAASFGASEWEVGVNEPLTKLARKELSKFRFISCRETSGVEICKSVFNVQATHVLDPLLQVSEEFIQSVINTAKQSSHKLVYYKLDHDEEFLNELKSFANQENTFAYNIYRKFGELDEYEEVSQWLRNIYDSEVVVSDSFHCICLALRFGKSVIYAPNPSRGQARMDDLFRYLDVAVEDLEGHVLLKRLVRSNSFNHLLEMHRERSASFIRNIGNYPKSIRA